jgi:hypothetical protein
VRFTAVCLIAMELLKPGLLILLYVLRSTSATFGGMRAA